MFKLFILILKLFFLPLSKVKRDYLSVLFLVLKEKDILKRTISFNKYKLRIKDKDRKLFSFFHKLSSFIKKYISIVKPETLLSWYKNLVKSFWRFPTKGKSRPGRPRISNAIRNIVLKIKNENVLMGYSKIVGELKKLGINLDRITVRNIILTFRKKGKVTKAFTWKKFIKSHLDSLFCMDFFTLDSVFNKRFYIFFIMCIKTREIVHFNITQNPNKVFVNAQLDHFRWDILKHEDPVYLIHDNASEFKHAHYDLYNIKDIPISAYSPNMNAYAERFVGSARREAFNWFILFSENQIRNILTEYIFYYNSKRPHQGIEQNVPQGHFSHKYGKIVGRPVLSGLFHYYKRIAS